MAPEQTANASPLFTSIHERQSKMAKAQEQAAGYSHARDSKLKEEYFPPESDRPCCRNYPQAFTNGQKHWEAGVYSHDVGHKGKETFTTDICISTPLVVVAITA